MSALLASLLLPLRQLDDRAFLAPLLKGALGAALGCAALIVLGGWGAEALLGQTGWLGSYSGVLGGMLALIVAVWLFVPLLLAVASLFLDDVASAVEARFYPSLPPARGASLAAQGRAGLGLAARVLLWTLLALAATLAVPPFGVVLFPVVATVSLGQGLFEGVAWRRMGVAEARALRRRLGLPVYVLGGALAALALVPVLNLLVPVLGAAAMTHLLHRSGPVGRVPA
ncbi:cysteine biosynthesis protein CysZ [Roseococcus sp. SYP-B2431]|uniref:EI24 domain-containing protein n=1 Tax=Roseococcus sp. SYP-B2431 TaxID=2496640 RepID=UPI0010407DB5|nr:EI24 domain-containing protein [Roseococcus sp. SYP-B2431]TCH97050.1 cysteine biosynthesis protein CysZ [Roseococcus sp. SYP-B2431]